MKPADSLKEKIDLLPESPGVYMYFDKDGTIIYVGKAKRLRRRVKSYFNREHAINRTNRLVRNIADLKYIVVNTEEDALLLENSLIKEYKPRYNVLLKDDKSYPWICVTNELYPRVIITREDVKKAHGKYFGPYPNISVVRNVLDLIREIYPIRTCSLPITRELIGRKKYRVCLEYHIKNCMGCCTGEICSENYNEYIEEIRQILSGNIAQLSDYLLGQMQKLAADMKFEEAHELKNRYLLLEKYKSKTVIVSAQIHDVDVFSFVRDDDNAYVNYMYVRNGAVSKSFTLELKARLGETDAEMLTFAIGEIQAKFGQQNRETIVPFYPDMEFAERVFTIPQRGDKHKLLKISEKNALQYKSDKHKRADKLNPEQRIMRVLTTMQRDFRLKELPRHIECFDNSNIQGSNPVASCVVFKNAKPSKRDYRHFNIKTVVGPDDFASMREVLTRRYSRMLAEGQDLPQLVVVDGGKGQLSSAVEALDAIGLRGKIALIGIAKRLEEIYFPGDSIPLYIDKNSESLKVIQHLRDEAHRFGITHHRNKRSKAQTVSLLDGIKGIGPVTREMLLRRFRSLKRIKDASLEELSEVVGKSKAVVIFNSIREIPDSIV
ncbi:MAG: excinuclease ABC subunit C [Muribaculaceae bacterium]|nr:excinuclease ABC subunit C [Muribaculaceae bacterium]